MLSYTHIFQSHAYHKHEFSYLEKHRNTHTKKTQKEKLKKKRIT